MKKTTTLITIIISLIVGCALGYFLGYTNGSKVVVTSYSSKAAEVSNLFPTPQGALFSLTGSVKEIDGNIVTIDANPLTPNPFAENNFPTVRTVTVADATTITQMQQKDQATLQQEMLAYQKAVSAAKGASSTLTPPMPFSETAIKLSDLKVGDKITVTAGSDIRTATSFTATKIKVQP